MHAKRPDEGAEEAAPSTDPGASRWTASAGLATTPAPAPAPPATTPTATRAAGTPSSSPPPPTGAPPSLPDAGGPAGRHPLAARLRVRLPPRTWTASPGMRSRFARAPLPTPLTRRRGPSLRPLRGGRGSPARVRGCAHCGLHRAPPPRAARAPPRARTPGPSVPGMPGHVGLGSPTRRFVRAKNGCRPGRRVIGSRLPSRPPLDTQAASPSPLPDTVPAVPPPCPWTS
ncbi:hypothetical protein COSO111634_04420 [Corallococcus soli]